MIPEEAEEEEDMLLPENGDVVLLGRITCGNGNYTFALILQIQV